MAADDKPQTAQTYDLSLLQGSMHKWRSSAGLRTVYADFYRQIAGQYPSGPILELGSGIGVAKDLIPDLITSDLIHTPYVDQACSAYAIPPVSPDGRAWQGIIALDVLHHLCEPLRFFASAAAALPSGGRIVLMEPAATAWGRIFYRLFHPEPIRPTEIQPPFVFQPDTQTGEFANMGMAVGLLRQQKAAFGDSLNSYGFNLSAVFYRDLFAYPFTGGYGSRQWLPTALIKALLLLEAAIPQPMFRLLGLRMMLVLQRR
jgi:hypothetical protein